VVGREVTTGRFTIAEAVALLAGATASTPGPWDKAALEDAVARYGLESGEAGADAARAFVDWLSDNR
jgi:hypothetical protein